MRLYEGDNDLLKGAPGNMYESRIRDSKELAKRNSQVAVSSSFSAKETAEKK